MTVNVQLSWPPPPNPNTLKYLVDPPLVPQGALNYTDVASAERESPLAARLFSVKGIVGVMFAPGFVTITKGEEGEWDELNDAVLEALKSHLEGGGQVLREGVLESRAAAFAGTPIESQIREILETEIRPAVAMDGGDISLERYENGIVYVNMKGSCSGCPSSTMTLKMGIESRLKGAIPEIQEVVAL